MHLFFARVENYTTDLGSTAIALISAEGKTVFIPGPVKMDLKVNKKMTHPRKCC